MSCDSNKVDAVADFNHSVSGFAPLQVYEETQSTNNQCDLFTTQGTLNSTLTFANGLFPTKVNGTGKIYLKVSKQTDGFSDTGVNTPPVSVSDPAVYKEDSVQTVTLNTSFVSTTYASATPAFSPSNACGADKKLGWQISDAQVIMTRTIIQSAAPRYS